MRDERSRSLLLTIPVIGLLLAALAIWVFAQIAEEVVEQETNTIDTLILQTIRLGHTPLLDQIMVGITFIGQPLVLVVISLGLGIWLLIQRRRFGCCWLKLLAETDVCPQSPSIIGSA